VLGYDLDLTDRDLAGLGDREAVRTLFARLGYAVERGRQTDPLAESMPERMTEYVCHIEVLAADSDDFVIVYVVEMTSVTVARINELARHFRNRAGDTLVVLTADYERLDLVLFDRQAPTDGARRPHQSIPRRLSYSRACTDPPRVTAVRRAVRRFSWTEPDSLGQWEKLRSAFSIGEWGGPYFDNRGPFSDHYLWKRLPERPG
jgi:hypothetical protein